MLGEDWGVLQLFITNLDINTQWVALPSKNRFKQTITILPQVLLSQHPLHKSLPLTEEVEK